MIHFVLLALLILGFAALALSMKRHHRDVFARLLSRREMLLARAGAAVCIVAALALAIGQFGSAYGVLVWFGYLSIAAWIVVAALCFKAHAQ
ncbi:DUF3325 domain-containing protein [Altericroceibacterium endophyticum]|uniref:DUF3325 family protein n=1 Tax=Altericroceibacterium endophyticum TaxID=1808508 RepID=A0A6I4T090_9SPHN|nr:DUF3325 domain-containing protein [Altericroceibacterium endophyticum]MXO64306.1 DUF3325 family protein [Altericroceibacterium endophyticum]